MTFQDGSHGNGFGNHCPGQLGEKAIPVFSKTNLTTNYFVVHGPYFMYHGWLMVRKERGAGGPLAGQKPGSLLGHGT